MRTADEKFMDRALELGRTRLGQTRPNPSVGCVIVLGNEIVGEGVTGPKGNPHGEDNALRQAGEKARGATAYVTLAPCAHGKLGGCCVDLLIKAGVARVVIATEDLDPRTAEISIARLKAAGIDVTVGVRQKEAEQDHKGFFTLIEEGRPMFTLKLAQTRDNFIAIPDSQERWITGLQAREQVQRMRAIYDAIMVGIGTVEADDPYLTCRDPGYRGDDKIRIVLDTHLRIALGKKEGDYHLVKTAQETPTWVIAGENANPARRAALEKAGVKVIIVPEENDKLDLRAVGQALGRERLTRVLCEGGAELAYALAGAKLIDQMEIFTANKRAGKLARRVPGRFNIGELLETTSLAADPAIQRYGSDILQHYVARLG